MDSEKEESGISITLNLFPFKAGFARIWAEISVIALILGLIAGKFGETIGTVLLVWLLVGLGKFILALPQKNKEKNGLPPKGKP
jgi:hypothetical protein